MDVLWVLVGFGVLLMGYGAWISFRQDNLPTIKEKDALEKKEKAAASQKYQDKMAKRRPAATEPLILDQPVDEVIIRAPSKQKAASAYEEIGLKNKHIVREKTREEMMGIFSTVKSINADSLQDSLQQQATNEEQRRALESSGVLDALANTLVTEVKTEEDSVGKFSRMSVDAALVFDESDAEEDKEPK